MPGSDANAAEFGYAGSGDERSAFPRARVVALAEAGTHAFLAAEIGACTTDEKTLAADLYPRLRVDELLTADRRFYSWPPWHTAQATGAAPIWRAPLDLELPVLDFLSDSTYLSVLINPAIEGDRRQLLLDAVAYHWRWEQDGHDQRKAHLRGPGRILRSQLPDLIHQEIWSYLIVHHKLSALTARAAEAAALDPAWIAHLRTPRPNRR